MEVETFTEDEYEYILDILMAAAHLRNINCEEYDEVLEDFMAALSSRSAIALEQENEFESLRDE